MAKAKPKCRTNNRRKLWVSAEAHECLVILAARGNRKHTQQLDVLIKEAFRLSKLRRE